MLSANKKPIQSHNIPLFHLHKNSLKANPNNSFIAGHSFYSQKPRRSEFSFLTRIKEFFLRKLLCRFKEIANLISILPAILRMVLAYKKRVFVFRSPFLLHCEQAGKVFAGKMHFMYLIN